MVKLSTHLASGTVQMYPVMMMLTSWLRKILNLLKSWFTVKKKNEEKNIKQTYSRAIQIKNKTADI